MDATEPAELRAPHEPPDWSTLAARAIDDTARMVQAEIHLAEASFRATLKECVTDAFAMLAVAGFVAAAALCLLAALIILLHHWFEWWLAFALAGCVSAAIGATIALAARPPKKRLGEPI
jgi:Putative Actinobacterial Holin-X, holin superfamily III